MNNDIIIEDANFEIVIEKFMSNNNIDVCGPDMVTLNNNHQNPLALEPYSSKYLKHRIKQDRIKCILLRNPIFWNIYKKYKKVMELFREKNRKQLISVCYMVHV